MRKISHLIALCVLLTATACNKNSKFSDDANADDKKPNTSKFDLNGPLVLDTLRSGVVVAKSGNDYIWQGDILLSPAQLKALDENGDLLTDFNIQHGPEKTLHPFFNTPIEKGSGNQRQIIANSVGVYPTPYNLWSMVRYTLNSNLDNWTRSMIQQGIAEWEANTNVRFYNATGRPTVDPVSGIAYPYVEFINASVNQSSIGRIGGRQEIKIAENQWWNAVVHEIGHAVGLYHEHCRYDRDDFVTVNIGNVIQAKRYNYDKVTTNYSILGGFDFNSIMLYGSYDFAIDGTVPTMTRKDGTDLPSNFFLSEGDRVWGNTYYLPYKARYDTYRELDDVVYKPDNTVMTAQERINLQAQLNGGNPNPPYSPPIESTPIYWYYNQGAKDFAGSSTYYPNGMWDGNWKYKFILGYGAWDQFSLPDAVPVWRYYNQQMIDNYYTTTDLGPHIPGSPEWARADITFWAFSQGGYGRVPIYSYVCTQNGHHALSRDLGASANLSNGLPYIREGLVFWVYPTP